MIENKVCFIAESLNDFYSDMRISQHIEAAVLWLDGCSLTVSIVQVQMKIAIAIEPIEHHRIIAVRMSNKIESQSNGLFLGNIGLCLITFD